MPTDPVLRRATADDVPAVAALLADVFPHNAKADPAVMRWQYWQNPFGPPSSWVWEHDGAPVGHVTAFAVPLCLGGRPASGAKTADFAVAEGWRGRGLITRALRAIAEDLGRRGAPGAVCTATNPAAWAGMQRAGVGHVGDLEIWVRPLVWAGRRDVEVAEEVDGPPDGLDHLWSAVAPHRPYGVVHDVAWWRWRYVARPASHPDESAAASQGTDESGAVAQGYRYFAVRRDGALVAAAVVAPRMAYGRRAAFVLELPAVDDGAAKAVIEALRRAPGGASIAVLAALPGSQPSRTAAAIGLRRVPRRLVRRPQHVGVLPTGGDAGLPSAPWTLDWADYDHL